MCFKLVPRNCIAKSLILNDVSQQDFLFSNILFHFSSSEDDLNVGLTIKPPQAERRRDKTREADKNRYEKYGLSKTSKKNHHRPRDEEYPRRRDRAAYPPENFPRDSR